MLRLGWVRMALISGSFGHRWHDKVRLAVFHARIALAPAVRRALPEPVTVRLAPDGHEVVIANVAELSVLRHVMRLHEYEARGEPGIIFDLGANAGFATLYFSRRYPDARIFAVEPDPVTYERLEHNVGNLSRVTLLRQAVGDADGPLRFFPSTNSVASSLIARPGAEPPVEVTGATIQSLMATAEVDHVDLLKVDIEGAEFAALRVAPLDRVGELIVELHYDLVDEDEESVRELFDGFGFQLDVESLPEPGRQLLRAWRATFDPV
jgi:FkbM family methyltransferase